MTLISGKINVLKIDKSRLFEGEKGTYLDIVLIPTPDSEYGDYMIVQNTEKGEDKIILGNGKEFGNKGQKQESSSGDSLPF